MTSEAEQNGAGTARAAAAAKTGSKPRYGVPVWRVGKPDAFLAASVDAARAAVEGIAPAEQVGRHLAVKSEGDRLVTHLFESRLPGYGGWQWYAVLTRNSRSKVVTVDELGLLPSEDSILAPEWVPWAERVRPEDAQQDDAQQEEAQQEEAADAPAGDSDAEQTGAEQTDADQADVEQVQAADDGGDDACPAGTAQDIPAGGAN
jgi:hypothetical protein